jgi:hypothetical protein
MHADVQGFVPHQISTVFKLVPTATFCKTLIMAVKQWGSDLNMKLEICLCEVSRSSNTKIRMQDGLTSTMFMILKRKHCMY